MTPVEMKLTIEGLQKAQANNARRIAALRPQGARGQAVQAVLAALHRYAITITHVHSGAWKASHRMAIDLGKGSGMVYVDPAAYNPDNVRVIEYASFWEAAGGEMAVYERTVQEASGAALRAAVALIKHRMQL